MRQEEAGWLSQNSAAVQALASAATLLVTVVLALLTAWYVRLTSKIANSAERQIENIEADRANYAQGLAALAGNLCETIARLKSRSENRALVEGEQPSEDEIRQVERLSPLVSGRAAEKAVLIARGLRKLNALSTKEIARRAWNSAALPDEKTREEWRASLDQVAESLGELESECRGHH